jgi:hypothetical protein
VCINCVVTATTFALPVIVGGVGVLQAHVRRTHAGQAAEAAVTEAAGAGTIESEDRKSQGE